MSISLVKKVHLLCTQLSMYCLLKLAPRIKVEKPKVITIINPSIFQKYPEHSSHAIAGG